MIIYITELVLSLNKLIRKMKTKGTRSFNLKSLLLGLCLASLIFLLIPRIMSPLGMQNIPAAWTAKIPPSLAHAVVHYATLNITPQQTLEEILVTAKVLERRSPCNFLVFGLGHDSLMWSALNHGGRTVFLEEDPAWLRTASRKFPTLEAYHVRYGTKLSQADELLKLAVADECTRLGAASAVRTSSCPLALTELPEVVYEVEWDVVMVDAPTGYFMDAPGRMGAIYTAGMAARGRREGETDVFVHDVDRAVEDRFSRAFLCEGYMRAQVGKLRHFAIPSHRKNPAISFCA